MFDSLSDRLGAVVGKLRNRGRLSEADVGAAMREKSFGFLALLTRLRQTCCDPDMLPWRTSPRL